MYTGYAATSPHCIALRGEESRLSVAFGRDKTMDIKIDASAVQYPANSWPGQGAC